MHHSLLILFSYLYLKLRDRGYILDENHHAVENKSILADIRCNRLFYQDRILRHMGKSTFKIKIRKLLGLFGRPCHRHRFIFKITLGFKRERRIYQAKNATLLHSTYFII